MNATQKPTIVLKIVLTILELLYVDASMDLQEMDMIAPVNKNNRIKNIKT